MRINYKRYPSLLFLKDTRMMDPHVREFFRPELFNGPKVYLTKSFLNAVHKSRGQLLELIKEEHLKPEGASISKIFMFEGTVIMANMTFSKGFESGALWAFQGTECIGFVDVDVNKGWVADQVSKVSSVNEFQEMLFESTWLPDFLLKYAETETVILEPLKKIKKGKIRHFNETSDEVLYVDSRWFRNIVRDEGFTVRGHFRLQPYKREGVWTKKLIWISEFEKHGYRSRARKDI